MIAVMSDAYRLSRALLGSAGAAAGQDLAVSALEQAMAALWAQARATWPDVELAALAFAQHLSRFRRPDEDPQRFLDAIHAADLYLACACAQGLAPALAALDRTLLSQVPAMVGRLDRSPAFADEVRQILRVRLLVAAGGNAPRIADYAGRGPLLGWLRVAALRTGLNLLRGQHPPAEGPSATALPAGGNLEHDYLRAHYQQAFRAAVKASLAALSAEQRTAVRLHFGAGLSADKIAPMLGVSRRTVYNWLTQSREAILKHTRRLLRDQFHLAADDVDSVIALCRSQADLSISQLLKAEPD